MICNPSVLAHSPACWRPLVPPTYSRRKRAVGAVPKPSSVTWCRRDERLSWEGRATPGRRPRPPSQFESSRFASSHLQARVGAPVRERSSHQRFPVAAGFSSWHPRAAPATAAVYSRSRSPGRMPAAIQAPLPVRRGVVSYSAAWHLLNLLLPAAPPPESSRERTRISVALSRPERSRAGAPASTHQVSTADCLARGGPSLRRHVLLSSRGRCTAYESRSERRPADTAAQTAATMSLVLSSSVAFDLAGGA